MCVQDVLPRIVDLVNLPQFGGPSKKKRCIERACHNKLSNTQTNSAASKALTDITNTSIGNYSLS